MKNKGKIADFEQSNPLPLFFEFGMSPDELKSEIIDCFSKYFQNEERLKKFATSDLVNNWLSYILVERDSPESVKNIEGILEIFNGAKSINQKETIEAYSSWLPEISQGISRFWSLYNNQVDINNLCVEDYLEESLRMIGHTIEGISKPFIKLLLHLNRIRRKKEVVFSEIKSKDLGVAIDELINTTNLNNLFIISKEAIRLNQWRNIAYHHNSKIVDGEIICWYKKNGIINEFKISRNELFSSLMEILLSFKLIRISETIFCFDNIDEIQESRNSVDKEAINIREEARLLDFKSSLSLQGFKIQKLKTKNDSSLLKLIDMQEYGDFQKRAIHSSQFLYNLWLYTKSKKLTVEYYTFSKNKFLVSQIDSKIFASHTKGDLKLSELLKDVDFSFISTNYTQNKDPFENLILSKNIKEHPQKFYSQQGEKLTIEEFSKKFILSIFTNYLVLISEGLKSNTIKINIGSDGSMAIADEKIVLRVPALIENKEYQLRLIELIEEVINLYSTGELKREIVENAKMDNKYFFKKSLVKQQLKNEKK
ncbi:hypothetical protein KO506_04805 [Polaribacter vadi]|uniref:hypothetical protein n=1 Tax=Polaribacter TaxID=52959 RepID=UPI001C0A0B42|nr:MULTISPECIES: hypothetical protein [Polaribacter]MBU3010708.1 hypothetical protein [Polaribacter vadi]MDO6740519.1 hypothetical protein [Polaribacter sp. 1_MG-2023]